MGLPEEIAAAVAFLASDDASVGDRARAGGGRRGDGAHGPAQLQRAGRTVVGSTRIRRGLNATSLRGAAGLLVSAATLEEWPSPASGATRCVVSPTSTAPSTPLRALANLGSVRPVPAIDPPGLGPGPSSATGPSRRSQRSSGRRPSRVFRRSRRNPIGRLHRRPPRFLRIPSLVRRRSRLLLDRPPPRDPAGPELGAGG